MNKKFLACYGVISFILFAAYIVEIVKGNQAGVMEGLSEKTKETACAV